MNTKKRFVILRHENNGDVHWDVMFELDLPPEVDHALETWSIPPQSLPVGAFRCSVTKLPHHRRAYLDYEGGIAGDRGTVRRIDAGTFRQVDRCVFELNGTVFQGILEIGDGSVSFVP